MRPRQSTWRGRGVGLIELLVVLAISGIILGVVAAFFSIQTRVSAETQARNELNVQVRAVGEALIQDLKLAGSRAVVDDAGRAAFVPISDAACFNRAECVSVTTLVNDDLQTLRLFYVSSLFLPSGLTSDLVQDEAVVGPSCRQIDYALDSVSNVLYRRDVSCSEATPPDVETFAFEFADGIESIALEFSCSGGSTSHNPGDCYAEGDLSKFVREGKLSISGLSGRRSGQEYDLSLSTAMPNMRSSVRFREP